MFLLNTNASEYDEVQRWPRSQDKYMYFDTSRKILSQDMLMCNVKALIFIILLWLLLIDF